MKSVSENADNHHNDYLLLSYDMVESGPEWRCLNAKSYCFLLNWTNKITVPNVFVMYIKNLHNNMRSYTSSMSVKSVIQFFHLVNVNSWKP